MQRWWRDRIAEYIGVNLAITPEDLRQGWPHWCTLRTLGLDWQTLVDELNEELAA